MKRGEKGGLGMKKNVEISLLLGLIKIKKSSSVKKKTA